MKVAGVITAVVIGIIVAVMVGRRSDLPEGTLPVKPEELRAPLATLSQQVWLGKPVDPLSTFEAAARARWPELDVRDARTLSGERRPPMVVVGIRGPEEKGDEAPDLVLSWVLRSDAPEQLRKSQAVVGALLQKLGAGLVRDVESERGFRAETFIEQRVSGWSDDAAARVQSFVVVEGGATRGMRAFGLPELTGDDPELLLPIAETLVSGGLPDGVLFARPATKSGPELERVTVLKR